MLCLSFVVPAQAVTHNHRELFGEDSKFGTPAHAQSIDLAVWVPVSWKSVRMGLGGKPLGPWRLTP